MYKKRTGARVDASTTTGPIQSDGPTISRKGGKEPLREGTNQERGAAGFSHFLSRLRCACLVEAHRSGAVWARVFNSLHTNIYLYGAEAQAGWSGWEDTTVCAHHHHQHNKVVDDQRAAKPNKRAKKSKAFQVDENLLDLSGILKTVYDPAFLFSNLVADWTTCIQYPLLFSKN